MAGRRWFGVLGGGSLLLLGAVIGVTVDRTLVTHLADPRETLHAGDRTSETLHEETLTYFQREFGLDSEQIERIHRIFQKHQGAVDSSWLEVRPHLVAVIDTVHAEIETVLSAEQARHFKEWIASRGAHPRH